MVQMWWLISVTRMDMARIAVRPPRPAISGAHLSIHSRVLEVGLQSLLRLPTIGLALLTSQAEQSSPMW
jgi:hypothetical protein